MCLQTRLNVLMITFSLPSFKAIRASWFGESAPAVDLAKQWIRAHAKNSRDTVDARPAAVIYYSAFKQKRQHEHEPSS